MTKSKIVYVDDDLSNLTHFKKMLSDDFDVDVHLRSTDFISHLDERDYDCYVFDIFMPLHDGFELLEKVRSHSEKKNVPVFIITSNSSDEVRVNSYKNGAADFMDRMIRKDEMIARIKARIDQSKENSHIFKIGNLSINLRAMNCVLEKKSIDLTMLEYKVLTGLAKNHPAKMTKNDLFELIWGKAAINDNNLNTHLYNLRKKIAAWDYEISNHRSDGFWLSKKEL